MGKTAAKPKLGKFVWWKIMGAREPYRWRLKSSNGKIICQSEGYRTKIGCMKGIAAVQAVAFDAVIVEQVEQA